MYLRYVCLATILTIATDGKSTRRLGNRTDALTVDFTHRTRWTQPFAVPRFYYCPYKNNNRGVLRNIRLTFFAVCGENASSKRTRVVWRDTWFIRIFGDSRENTRALNTVVSRYFEYFYVWNNIWNRERSYFYNVQVSSKGPLKICIQILFFEVKNLVGQRNMETYNRRAYT